MLDALFDNFFVWDRFSQSSATDAEFLCGFIRVLDAFISLSDPFNKGDIYYLVVYGRLDLKSCCGTIDKDMGKKHPPSKAKT